MDSKKMLQCSLAVRKSLTDDMYGFLVNQMFGGFLDPSVAACTGD